MKASQATHQGPENVCRAVLLWITLWVLTLVTAGMALLQHRNETDAGDQLCMTTSSKEVALACVSVGQSLLQRCGLLLRLLPHAPSAPVPDPSDPIPSGAAWIVAVLLGSVMTLGALVFPTDAKSLREARAADKSKDAEVYPVCLTSHCCKTSN